MKCPTCKGDGYITIYLKEEGGDNDLVQWDLCQACQGSGQLNSNQNREEEDLQ